MGGFINKTSFLYNATGISSVNNYLLTSPPEDRNYFYDYAVLNATRNAIHVGCQMFDRGDAVQTHLLDDLFQSYRSWLIELMENYKVLIYNGNLDIVVANVFTENMINKLG